MEEHAQIHTLATFPWECIAGIQCKWGYEALKANLNLVSAESPPLSGMWVNAWCTRRVFAIFQKNIP